MLLLRMTSLTALVLGMLGVLDAASVPTQPKVEAKKPTPQDLEKVKKALAEVQDFIGNWELEVTQKVGTATKAWKENLAWGWKFAPDDIRLKVDFAEGKGKTFTDGTLGYDAARKKYVLTLNTADKTEQVFEGEVRNGTLKAEWKDSKTNDVHRLTLNTLDDGVRFQLKHQVQQGGKGLAQDRYVMNGKKEGTTFAGAKKPECIVSGGAANIAVQYNGKTYYVCCTGCRDEFNANPKKYVK